MAEEHGEGVGRCILVGLHMDAVGRDLLRWALCQGARRGDRIVAVHIYRKSGWYHSKNELIWQFVFSFNPSEMVLNYSISTFFFS